MTIRVEREALLRVINTSESTLTDATRTSLTSLSSKPCNPYIRKENEFVIVDSVPTKTFYSDLIPGSLGDDDLASVCTLSTSSVSSFDYSSSDVSTVERRVTFASQIVTDVWTRERTPLEEVSNLYYSSLETQAVGTIISFVRDLLRRAQYIVYVASFRKLVKCTTTLEQYV